MMNLVRPTLLGCVWLTLAAGSVRAQEASEYTDDFTTDKARQDCYVSSTFWPSEIDNPPSFPYLSYLDTEEAQGLAFLDYRGDLAQLGYSFVLGPLPAGTPARGTLRLDVSFPCNEKIHQFPPGQLVYSTSINGLTWSAPQIILSAGRRDIPIQSATGTWYILFTGARAVISNLRVFASTPGATVQILQNSGTRLASSAATRTIHHVDGSQSRWPSYATIQEAIDNAGTGDIVVVWPGVYEEEIRFDGKAITVQSAADAAILTAPEGYAVSFYDAEGSKSILANFVITGCGEGAVFCNGASPTLRNLTITGNPAGIAAYSGANPYIVNSIFWNNSGRSLPETKANFKWQVYYSCMDRSYPNTGVGNIYGDPRFADPQKWDFHEKSPWGRYLPWAGTWVLDAAANRSPCIDAGDPKDTPRSEPVPNGSRINIGAYGGTPFASRSNGPLCP